MKTPVKYLIERFEFSCGKDFITGYNTFFKNALKMEEKIKNNERNAGRKKVLNGQKVIITVPKDKVHELKNYAKTLIVYVGIKKSN